ncbi:YoaK family small membrane protein [Buttiauxella sp.]|uniref:YoaK family small membrane protein n=1 Tax=Buttiauxella sp. TaxID=1972222 RepID=UPI003C75FB86
MPRCIQLKKRAAISGKFFKLTNEIKMKIGVLFPIAIIVAAIVFITWFIVGGYATSPS